MTPSPPSFFSRGVLTLSSGSSAPLHLVWAIELGLGTLLFQGPCDPIKLKISGEWLMLALLTIAILWCLPPLATQKRPTSGSKLPHGLHQPVCPAETPEWPKCRISWIKARVNVRSFLLMGKKPNHIPEK